MQTLVGYRNTVLRVVNGTNASLFRELTPEEEAKFIKWAKEHRMEEVRSTYHPIIQNYMLLAQEKRALDRMASEIGDDTGEGDESW